MRSSLRARLIAVIVLMMFCGLTVTNVAGVFLLRSYLEKRVDQQLSTPFPTAETPVPAGFPRDVCSLGRSVQLPTSFVLVVFDRSGAERCRLPATPGAGPDLSRYATSLTAAAADGRIETVPGDRAQGPWRVRAVARDDVVIALCASLADGRATIRQLALLSVLTSLVIMILTAAGATVLVRIGLRPLTAIERTSQAIAAGDLSLRAATAPATTEVGRLANAFNAMIARIEQAFADRAESEERLRRFVADASHELRTPLATIRGHAELYRQGVATTPGDVQRILGRIESESVRLSTLVDDLLLLARLDASAELELERVDLLSVAADAVVDARAQDPDRAIVLRHRSDPAADDEAPVVRADERRLRQVMVNLLSNALTHTPAATPIEVEVGSRDVDGPASAVELRVVDHGLPLDPATAPRVFERFFRGDPSRTRGSGGTGLGLSIVASLVAAHEGSVRVEPTPGGGSTFVVALPTAGPRPGATSAHAQPHPSLGESPPAEGDSTTRG